VELFRQRSRVAGARCRFPRHAHGQNRICHTRSVRRHIPHAHPEVAYIKLSSIKAADLHAYFDKAKNTRPDRRHPQLPIRIHCRSLWCLLATKPRPSSLQHHRLANPGAFYFGDGPLIAPGPVHYGGKVAILVDETSQSQAEYTAMALRAMPNAVVVGSTTAGADGNLSQIPLPGA